MPSEQIALSSPRSSRLHTRQLLLDNMIWLLISIMVVLLALTTKGFFAPNNLLNVLLNSSVLGILVIGKALVLLTGKFDLSIESTMGLAAMIAGWLVSGPPAGSNWNINPFLAMGAALVIGLVIGSVNGFFIVKLQVDAFMVTLSMLVALRGLVLLWTKGTMLYGLPWVYRFVGAGRVAGIPFPVVLLILVYIVIHVVLTKRVFGRQLYAVGANEMAARASGINTARIRFLAYALSGVAAALAGLMQSGRLNVVPTNLGQGMTFEAFAAAVLGGISLKGGRGTIIGALGGVLFMGLINNALNLYNVSPFWVMTTRGTIVLFAVLVDALKGRFIR